MPFGSPSYLFSLLPKSVKEAMLIANEGGGRGRHIRGDQIKQWFNPDSDILPETQSRPQSLTKFGNQKFRSPGIQNIPWDRELNPPDRLVGKTPDEIRREGGIIPLFGASLKDKDEKQSSITNDLEYNLGLGEGKVSAGLDEKTGKPYLSAFDSWDFEGNPLTSEIMEGGKPYNIYQRFPIPLDEHGEVTSKPFPVTVGRGDIELPRDKPRKSSFGRKKR